MLLVFLDGVWDLIEVWDDFILWFLVRYEEWLEVVDWWIILIRFDFGVFVFLVLVVMIGIVVLFFFWEVNL